MGYIGLTVSSQNTAFSFKTVGTPMLGSTRLRFRSRETRRHYSARAVAVLDQVGIEHGLRIVQR